MCVYSYYLITGGHCGNNGTGGEGNGCARFVEIATQTVNLTNILTNLNNSVTNCNNTSDPNCEQIVSPTTILLSPTKTQNDEKCDQLSNSKTNNNGHCIIDDNSNDDRKQLNEMHHSLEMVDVDALAIDAYQGDGKIVDEHVKLVDSVTEIPCEINIIGKTSTTESDITTTTTTADGDTDLTTTTTKKHTSTDGINGPSNDLRV